MNEKIRKAWKGWAYELVLVMAILVAAHFWQTRHVQSGRVPDDALRLVDGTTVRVGGKPLMVHLWATWCGVCRAEEGNVSSVVGDHDVVTIASDSGSDSELRRVMTDRGLSWHVVNDPSGAIARAWGVSAFPTTFYVTSEGTIRTVEVGYTTTLGMRARLWWAGLGR